MKGFDSEFADIDDYIRRITDRIWRDKDFQAIARYYTEDAVIHTLGGPVMGSEKIIEGTKATLEAFPNRELLAEDVIWGGDDQSGYYTSHRIISPDMENSGDSDFSPATNKTATVRTIADCKVRDNRIDEEWLMRDNMGLVIQLGLDHHDTAKALASKNQNNKALHSWLKQEIERVKGAAPHTGPGQIPKIPSPHINLRQFVRVLINALWCRHDPNLTKLCYNPACGFHWPGNAELEGPDEMLQSLDAILSALDERCISVDNICSIPRNDREMDIAVRWTLAGVHKHDGIYGPPTHKPILILAASHWHTEDGKISEDWTVFDELAVLQQVYHHRLFPS